MTIYCTYYMRQWRRSCVAIACITGFVFTWRDCQAEVDDETKSSQSSKASKTEPFREEELTINRLFRKASQITGSMLKKSGDESLVNDSENVIIPHASAFDKWWTAALASTLAESATFPLDVAKTQMQLERKKAMFNPMYERTAQMGILLHLKKIYATRGVEGCFSGLGPAVARQAVSGGISIGFYQDIKQAICGRDMRREEIPVWKKLAAGACTGFVGQFVAMPLDVVKVRLQADVGQFLQNMGAARQFRGPIDAMITIYMTEGFIGFFKGTAPSLLRAAVINGTGLATYDHMKALAIARGWADDSTFTHILCSMGSALTSTVVSVPLDVIKTRMITGQYRGIVDCSVQTMKQEGFWAIYKGFLPTLLRLGPWQIIFFVSYETLSVFLYGYSFQTAT